MFSAGARRSSLRPKTPGRTPGPSRFSVGRNADQATPGGVPRRFTDSEVSKDQAFAGNGAEESPQIDNTSETGNAVVDRGLSSRQNAQTISGAFGGNGFASPSTHPHSGVGDGGPGPRLNAPEHAQVLQNTEAAVLRPPPRNAPFESPGVGALSNRAHAMNEGLGLLRQRTAGVQEDEGRAVVVASTQANEEEVWRRFVGAGTLDEQMLVRREKEELQRRLEDVQRELADYRYNLGVLILEHKSCGARNGELEDALRRTQEELHNEGRSLRMALDNAARREDGLQNSLKLERAAIADLALSLKEMHAKLESAEETSRERLSKAEQLEAENSQERKHVEELGRKASRELRTAQELEAGVKVRESEVDGKIRGMQEREEEVVAREQALQNGQNDLRAAESAVREKEFALADQKRSLEKELERGQKEIKQAKREGESRIEALRLSVEEEREKMQNEMREAKAAAEQGLAVCEKEVTAKEENVARTEATLQALLKEAQDKQGALSVRQQELEERERLLGEEKHRMLLKEAELLDQEGNLAEDRARLAEQETEWQRIESKLEAGGKELEARETALQAREAELESALGAVTVREVDVHSQEEAAQLKEAELQSKQETLAQLQKETDESMNAMIKEKSALESTRRDLEKREVEEATKEQQLQTRLEELEKKAAELEDRERRLRVRGLELSNKEQTLTAREHQVALRESGTEKDLQERWDALEARQRATEADLAKQLKQLQSDKGKNAAIMKRFRAQVEEERESVKKELQETRAALETEFQTKVLKIQEKLGQKLMVSETEKQKAVETEVEKRVKEITEGFEVKLEEKLALKLAERFAGVKGEVEKRVEELVKERVKGLEKQREEEVEKRVEELVNERVKGMEEQRKEEVERRVKKEVEGQVKARVKEAMQKAKEEANAKSEREKELAVQKALKAVERRAQDEITAALLSAREDERKGLEQETENAIETALKAAQKRAESEKEAAVLSAKVDARLEFELEKESAVQKALKAAEKRAESEKKAEVLSARKDARKGLEQEADIAVQKALKAAEKRAESEREAAVLKVKEDARKELERETENAVRNALEVARKQADGDKTVAVARAKAEERAHFEREKEAAIQKALEELENKTEDGKRVAIAKAKDEARARLEREKQDAIDEALQVAELEKMAAVATALEEASRAFEQEKATAVQNALEAAETRRESETRAAIATAVKEATREFEQEKATAVQNAVETAETRFGTEKRAAVMSAQARFEQEKATAIQNAVKAAETRTESEKRAAVVSAKASFAQEREAAVRNALESAEKKAESEKREAVAAAVKDAAKGERTRLAGKERADDEERHVSEGDLGELGNSEKLRQAKIPDVAQKEQVSKRGWLGMLSPRRPIRTPQPVAEIAAVNSVSETLPVDTAVLEVEPVPVRVNPVESPADADAGAILTEPEAAETASVNAFGTPKTSKPAGKRKLSQPSFGERPPKQRKRGRRKDAKPDTETGIVKGPVEALGAAVIAVGRAADAVTGPFGFVLDDTDLGFVPGSTETPAERDQGVKKPSWSLWPGFLSPRKSKPSEETQDIAEAMLEEEPLPERGSQPSTEPTPLEEAGATEAVAGGPIGGQTNPSLVAIAEQGEGRAPRLGSVLDKTISEIDLRSVESGIPDERPSLVSKTPKRSSAQTPKPSRTPKPFPPAVRASSRLRERALSSELLGSLELPAASQLPALAEIPGRGSQASLEPPAASQLPALAEVPGRGSPGEGQDGLPAPRAEDGSPSLRAHRSLTPEEQAKLDRLLESFEAEEQAIANDEAVLNPPSPVVLKPPTPAENAPLVNREPLTETVPSPSSLTPDALTPGLRPTPGGLEPLTTELSPEEMGPLAAELQPFGTPGLESSKGVVKRTGGGGRSVERLKKEDLLRARAAKASGRTSDTFLTEAEMAKEQDLPDEDMEETPAVPPGGASLSVDADLIGGSPVSDSPPVLKTTLLPKTPKSAFGRMFGSFFGSSRTPASDERQEGTLEGEGATYKSQVKELRSIVDDLVGAADRDDEMGGPERQEFDPPEGDEQSEGEPEQLEFDTPEGSYKDPEYATPLEGLSAQGGTSEQGGFMSVAQSVLVRGEAVLGVMVSEGKQLGGEILRKTPVRPFDLNEKAAEFADEVVGVAAADVAVDVADDVIALGAAAGQVAEALTGNIGEALAAEALEEGVFNTGPGAGNSLVGTSLEVVAGTLEGATSGAGIGLRPRTAREPTPSYGTAIEGGAPTEGGPARGVQPGAKSAGGNEAQSLQRRGIKRKAAQSESKGKQVKESEAETGDEGASNRTRVRKRVKGTESGDEPELLDPRVVDFAAKFDGMEELETDGSETGRRRKRSKSVVDPRDGEDVTAGLRRYNLRKSTLVKMHVWEPRGADFDTGADNESIHTRAGAASSPRNLRRSVFGGDNPFLEDIAPGNPHSLEEIRTPRSTRGARGERGVVAPQDEEAEQANAGWRWLGFLGW